MITPYEGYVESATSIHGPLYFSVVLVNTDDPDNTLVAVFSRNDIDADDVPLVADGALFYLMTESPIRLSKPIPRHSITFIRPRTGA